MKKLVVLCVAVAGMIFTNSASAQVKIGYFDEQAALSLFPGIQKIDTLMNSYRLDSLQEEYKFKVTEFQRKDSLFKKDSATLSVKGREMATRDILQLRYQLVNWQQYQQEMEQAKYEQLVNPYRIRVAEALAAIVAENKYTIVLKAESLSPYVQPNLLDNLTIRVAQKLKLPLPKEIEDAWKAASGGGGTTAPAAKPATKPAVKG
jgi:hypothetical protein